MKKEITRTILKVFAFGGIAALFSGLAIALVCAAVYAFCMIPCASGYLAVALFVVALLAVALAFVIVYLCGYWIVKKGHYVR